VLYEPSLSDDSLEFMDLTIKVSNLTKTEGLNLNEQLNQFFSYCGQVTNLYVGESDNGTFDCYITFNSHAAISNALMLSGAKVNDSVILVTLSEDQEIKQSDYIVMNQENMLPADQRSKTSMIATLLAQGYKLKDDALTKAREFDSQQGVSSGIQNIAKDVSGKVEEIDQKFGISTRLIGVTDTITSAGREFDQQYNVTGMTKSAITTGGETISNTANQVQEYISSNENIQNGIEVVTNAAISTYEKTNQYISSNENIQNGIEVVTNAAYTTYEKTNQYISSNENIQTGIDVVTNAAYTTYEKTNELFGMANEKIYNWIAEVNK